MQVVGPSGAGKTYFVCNLLNSTLYKHALRRIYWHMGTDDKPPVNNTKIKFIKGFPEGWLEKLQRNDAIVIDDLFEEQLPSDFNSLFTKVARHRGVAVIFITQNLFHRDGRNHRTRNLNAHYLVIFKNPRDCTTIDYIARQAYPNNRRFLIDSYNDAVEDRPHGYLFIDFTQDCPDNARVRSRIFEEHAVYKQMEQS